jgi:hypothetical protein
MFHPKFCHYRNLEKDRERWWYQGESYKWILWEGNVNFIAGECIKQHIWTQKWGVVKEREKELKWFGTERGSCLHVSTYTQNGRYTKNDIYIVCVVRFYLVIVSLWIPSFMHKSKATLMGNLLNSGHLFSCHSWKNLFIANDKSTEWRERKKSIRRNKKVKTQRFPSVPLLR